MMSHYKIIGNQSVLVLFLALFLAFFKAFFKPYFSPKNCACLKIFSGGDWVKISKKLGCADLILKNILYVGGNIEAA